MKRNNSNYEEPVLIEIVIDSKAGLCAASNPEVSIESFTDDDQFILS